MQSATAVQVMPVQNAARQARCTSTNGTAAGYMKSSCSASGCWSREAALAAVERAVESGVLKGASAPGRDDAGVLRDCADKNEAAALDRPPAAAHLQRNHAVTVP